ncbi:MAG: hypothetical protein QXO51_07730 [Halobacteria archaeon]
MKVFPYDVRRGPMEKPAPRKVRPARVAAGVPVPQEVRAELESLARRHGRPLETVEARFRHMEGYDLIRERFQGRPERERWDYILQILEERLKDEAPGAQS